MTASVDLMITASKYSDDIGTADYLVKRFMGASDSAALVMPGQIINWVVRMNPQGLGYKLDSLSGLLTEYKYVSQPSTVKSMKNHWTGLGGEQFQHRYDQLDSHLVGEGAAAFGRHTAVDKQIEAFRELCTDMEVFQQKCGEAIKAHLAGLRAKYITAVVSEGEKSTEAIVTALVGVGKDAFGVATGGPAAIPGLVGSVVNAIFAFANENAKNADSMLDELGHKSSGPFRLLQKDIEYTASSFESQKFGFEPYQPDISDEEVTDDDPW